MKLLVTGASGFLGKYVVDECLRRGHTVRAMVRSAGAAAKCGWEGNEWVETAVADLRSRRGLVDAVRGVDGVLHLAAAKAGDVYAQYGGTVVATENLLWAMTEAGVRRIVHISSFSVYQYLSRWGGSTLDETSPVENDAFERDAYAHTKLVQERLVREHAAAHGWQCTVLRPGMIFGKNNLWGARCGAQAGRVWVRMGTFAPLPLAYVENVADAIVQAAETDAGVGQVLNVVDDETPTQRRYVKMLQNRTSPQPVVVPVPWTVLRFLARSAWLTNKVLLRGRAKLPGLLIPCRLHARFKPLKYPNDRIKQVLGWRPRYSLEEAVDRSLAGVTPPAKERIELPSLSPLGERAGVKGKTSEFGGGVTPTDPPHPPPHPNSLPQGGEGIKAGQLRIAYMTGEYPRATDTFIQREVAALRRSGVHVETLSVRKPAAKETVSPQVQAERDRTYYVLPAGPLKLIGAHLKLMRRPGRYLSALGLAMKTRPAGMKALVWQAAYFAEAGLVARRMNEHGLDHLHNHFSNSSCSVAMLASALGGFTYSFTMHGPSEFFEPKYWRIDEKVRRAKFVNCISHFCRSQAMVFAPQDAWDKLHIIHCGVDPAEFPPVRHEGRGSRLLFVGRLAGVKGLPVLLEALAQLKTDRPEVRLVVAGDGPDRARLEAMARRLGVSTNVEFRGYQSQAQVRELLQQTDAFVMASFAEGVPVVLMEAMASGVPVVATQIAGIPELVEDGTSGYLVPPGDATSVALAVSKLLDDPALRNRLGAAGRKKVVKEFNIGTEAEKLCEVMTGALQGQAVTAGNRASTEPVMAAPAPVPA